ncbi:Golgi-associated kinase 1A [Nelusetta ayraudi]|uniref:Golgi-associated kinase 1A n=1 Tax=Nelusetta ayraudi TaxID=303726 RepID=UPI003F6FDF0D
MAWQLRSKTCCGQKWLLLLLCPASLLFLTLCVMTLTLPLPSPPGDGDRRPSRALSSAGRFPGPRLGIAEPPPPNAALRQAHSDIRRGASSSWREAAPKPFRVRADPYRVEHKGQGLAAKRKETNGAERQRLSRHQRSKNKGPEPRITPSNRSTAAKSCHPARSQGAEQHAGQESRHGRGNTRKLDGRHKAEKKQSQQPKRSSKASREHQAVEEASRDPPPSPHQPSRTRETTGPLGPRKDLPKLDEASQSGPCLNPAVQDFPEGDRRPIRVGSHLRPLPWLSEDDLEKMALLAGAEVVSKVKVPAHGQVLQVALEPRGAKQPPLKSSSSQHGPDRQRDDTHSERCLQGRCSLIKRTEDWFEVFAFHLDRVLGLNRSLPAVLRAFKNEILPYRYISGTPRPAVWWDPDIQHLANKDNDQNSVPLSWLQYQELLKVHCGADADLKTAPCVGIQHSEWGRLALFDFLLQVHDRLDRYCCGFTPDPTELCMENLLRNKCGSPKDLLLVHILVRKADLSRLVFIDNAGRPQQTSDNLNLRLLEGIDEFPARAVSVLQSGCLESLLLRSLYTDREFWESRGGVRGIRPLIRTVEQRGKILLQRVREKKMQLKSDL